MWFLRMTGLLLAVFLIGWIVCWLGKRLRRETIDQWGGEGAQGELTFAEAAVVLGRFPAAIIALFFHDLARAGKAEVLSEHPLALRWTGGEPLDGAERAFGDALDPEGHLRPEGVIALLEAIYAAADAKMVGRSGAQTAILFEEEAQAAWDRMREEGTARPEEFGWLLLLEPEPEWDLFGTGPAWDELKRELRLKARFREAVRSMPEIAEAARHAKEGFFAHRPDLIDDGNRIVDAELATWSWR